MKDPFVEIRTKKISNISEIEDISIISDDNHTLLQDAIARFPENALALIEAGVPLDHQDNNGQTALQYAIARSYYDLAIQIIQRGGDVNLVDKYGNSALWTAVMQPRPDLSVVKALVQAGADVYHKNNVGRNPMDMARTKKNHALIEVLSRGQ